MSNTKSLAVAVLALASLAGCANAPVAGSPCAVAAAEPPRASVSRPAAGYGSMGGYRYRRFVAVTASAS